MNNARKSFNMFLYTAMLARLPDFTLFTGDEDNPQMTTPAVGIHWLDGQQPGRLGESRKRLVQLEVVVVNADTSRAEQACEILLDILSLRTGTQPKGLIPKRDYSSGSPVDYPYPMPPLMVTATPNGWQRLPSPQQRSRFYALTLEVDYVPDTEL